MHFLKSSWRVAYSDAEPAAKETTQLNKHNIADDDEDRFLGIGDEDFGVEME